MMDAIKEYLAPKRFGIVAYVCVIVHFLCGLVLTAVTVALRASEIGKFSCIVAAKSTATYKTQVDKACFSRYEQAYNTPLPLYGFVLLSIGSTVLVSVIYSLVVSKRVDEIESRTDQGDAPHREHGENRTVYVFSFYFFACGIIFTLLQHKFFFPNGFDLKFSCNIPPAEVNSHNIMKAARNASDVNNNTSVSCENPTASEKKLFGTIVSVINVISAFVILVEVIFLWQRLPVLNCHFGVGWSCDTEFVNSYLLRKPYIIVPDTVQLVDFQECIDNYKQHILNRPRDHDITYLPNTALDDLHVDVIIHTGRAQCKFSEYMARHEMYDVYMKIPPHSLRLEEIKDLFYPNKDTKGVFPQRILVIGRPGVGKTVLTEKIICDWANGIDKYYSGKIVLFFKFRWFNIDQLASLSLKEFLQVGTRSVGGEMFESIYDEIIKEPQKAILIFDGLDEFNGNPFSHLDQSEVIPHDTNTCMHAMNIFIKIISGTYLHRATVLVTSRPTTPDFCIKLNFNRNVEIIGFTRNKIEEYVNRFCDNYNRSDMKPKIWNHINSSSELLNLCYIPANCFVLCVTLSGCLSKTESDTVALPTTLTELYQAAIDHFEKRHYRNVEGNSNAAETLQKLQLISFDGMANGKLIFNREMFDEHMKMSGLVNSLSNPIFPIQTQFCFIHLTIQEFLAAKHVTETFAPADIKEFISSHFDEPRWHLVLQFIAGLLGKQMTMFDCKYEDCVMEYAKGFKEIDNEIELNYDKVLVMKCLKELDNERIAKDICERTPLKDVECLDADFDVRPSPSDWAAANFVCKYINNLSRFVLEGVGSDCLQEILKLLQNRCVAELWLGFIDTGDVEVEYVFNTLTDMQCTRDHTHTNLSLLTLCGFSVNDQVMGKISHFFITRQASHLQRLVLTSNEISPSAISKFCEVFDSGHFVELTCLDFSDNPICDEGASVLFNTLTKGPRKLTELRLLQCSLTSQCVHTLVKTLQDEHCKIVKLNIGENDIGDEGVRLLCENALTKEHCKITDLFLENCSLTEHCILHLCRALQDERCKLNVLSLLENQICDEGACVLFEDGITQEHCKLTKLNLSENSLTDKCIPRLCKALADERCKLNVLSLSKNKIGDEGACVLFEDGIAKEHCKLTELYLGENSLTDKCLPTLRKALQDERCKLTKFSLLDNDLTNDGQRIFVLGEEM